MRAWIVGVVFLAGVGCGSDDNNADGGMGDMSMDLRTQCMPGDVSGFTPTWHPPTGLRQGKCVMTQIDGFITNVLQGTPTEKAAWKASNTACFDCMLTTGDATALGPILDLTATFGVYAGNIGGCAALLDGDTTATGCGAKLSAVQSCGLAACQTTCKVTMPSNIPDFNQCVIDAPMTSCSSYNTALAPCTSTATNDQLKCQVDAWSGDIAGWFAYLGDVFCGPPGDM